MENRKDRFYDVLIYCLQFFKFQIDGKIINNYFGKVILIICGFLMIKIFKIYKSRNEYDYGKLWVMEIV